MIKDHISNVEKIVSLMGKQILNPEWYENIDNWITWYQGKVDDFHKYKHFNGKEYVDRERSTLQMPKMICEDWATLLYNDRTAIKVDENHQELLDKMLQDNSFEAEIGEFIEQYMALGIGATVVYKDAKNNPKINFIPAPMIFPLRVIGKNIVDCIFASVENDIYYINTHELLQNGKYRISNTYWKFSTNSEDPERIANKRVKGSYTSDIKLFQIYKPGIANNIDMFCPFGISVYGNALDRVKNCDLLYDSFRNEFALGKKRIFIRDDLLSYRTLINENGQEFKVPIFDSNDTEFYSLPSDDENGNGTTSPMITEVNGQLRVQEHIDGIQSALNLLSDACGLGNDRYNFQEGNVYTNNSQVISTQSKLYKTLLKHEKKLRAALIELVRTLISLKDGTEYTEEITVDFDDSIIEDSAEIQRRALLELNNGIIDHVEYLVQVYKYTEEQAIEFFNKIQERAPEPEEEPDLEE